MSRSLFAKLHRRFGTKLSGAEISGRAHAKQAEFTRWLALASLPPDCGQALPNGVAIVGGGLAGLSAAWTLGHAGVASTVFEARKTYGGRVESDSSFIPGRIIEAGAELIGFDHPMWLELAKQFGLGLTVLTGEEQYAGAGLEIPLRIGGKPVTDHEKLYKQMAFVLQQISNDAKVITDPFAPWTAPGAAALDAKSVADKIAGFVRLLPKWLRHPLLVDAIELQLGNDNVLPTKEQSYLGLLALVSGGRLGPRDVNLSGYWEHSEDFRCSEGNSALAGMMLEYGKRILFRPNSPVIKIEISETDPLVKLTWSDPYRGHLSKNFDYVILTAPPSVWKKIAITPALPPGQEMGLGAAVKYVSQVHDRFWIKTGMAPSGASDELGQTWEATENQALASRGVALSVFAGGKFVPKSDAPEHFRTQLLKLYPDYRMKADRYVDWPSVPWIETGYACPKVGQVTTIGRFLSVPHKKRLFFAGEHTCMAYFGYMEGALQSGVRAAKAILAPCLKKSSMGIDRDRIVQQTRPSADEGASMNRDAQSRFLDEAERALQSTNRERRQFEISFLPRLLRALDGSVSVAELSPAALFSAFLHDRSLLNDARNVLEVLAMPSRRPDTSLRPGDLMLRAVPGTGDVGHVSVLASRDLFTPSEVASKGIAAESATAGRYGLVIEAGAFPHSRARPFARRMLDSRGRVPPNTLFLRPKFFQPGAAPELPPDSELEDLQRTVDVEKGLSGAPFLLGRTTISPAAAGQDEEFEDYDRFAEDDPVGSTGRPVLVPATSATIGFEFDLNIGLSREVFTARAADMPRGATFPGPGDKITDHREDDGTGKLADGFQVKADGPRLEIATLPIKVDDDATFLAVVNNVIAFARELQTERGKVTPDRSISVTDVAGHPVRFTHPRTLISKFPLVVAVRGPQNGRRWPSDRGVWSAPQATITILLEHVGELIDAIAKSAGTGLGKALSGGPSLRLGVRSDIVVMAKRRVVADRATKIGTVLSDKSTVTADDYSPRLAGLLMLMTSYMLSGEIVDSDDYELFAKAYLPINVKAPFRDLFREALSARERLLFKELYFDNRADFFALAKDRATTHDENNELFPLKVRGPDLDRFHLRRLTWGTLLDNTVNDIPLKVTRANSVAKKHHALGDEVLWAPISKIIPFVATKPRVALELRRIGFAAHPVKFWEPLMNTVRTLSKKW